MNALTLAELSSNELTLVVVAIAIGGGVALLSMFFTLAQNMHRTRQIEQSRREIAAYIAEGSMSPEEGERLLRAEPGKRNAKVGCWGWGCGKS